MGSVLKRIRRGDMENIRVVVPKKNDEYYKQAFIVENYPVSELYNYSAIKKYQEYGIMWYCQVLCANLSAFPGSEAG